MNKHTFKIDTKEIIVYSYSLEESKMLVVIPICEWSFELKNDNTVRDDLILSLVCRTHLSPSEAKELVELLKEYFSTLNNSCENIYA